MNWKHELVVPGKPVPLKREDESYSKYLDRLDGDQKERLEAVAARLGIEVRTLWKTYIDFE